MPLRDHFHSPVNDKRHWSEAYGGWPAELTRHLFDLLPPGFQAGPRVTRGSPSEFDDTRGEHDDSPAPDDAGGETPTLTVSADLSEPDAYQVRIYDAERQLIATIEIVSPANKDRPTKRDQFTGKVADLLRQDVCVVIVDVVTNRLANLYAEVLARFGRADPSLGESPPPVYAVTLRGRKAARTPQQPRKQDLLDAWFFRLVVGQPLPTVPLWLGPDLVVNLPLEPSYQEVCRLLRIA